ncbi:uncharacterized protein LOC124613731 [Schistocerca americana]|uniref:uncharacterized protein LOC124613731 n=1 Tax=Schistocerca americana TaxID=7009 RepID=UPI001F4F9044|nr:uncharacterized protein LOC124613731 [Schistocerca americana]
MWCKSDKEKSVYGECVKILKIRTVITDEFAIDCHLSEFYYLTNTQNSKKNLIFGHDISQYYCFLIMGNSRPSVSCCIICVGEGPVISVVPLDLPWNETLLLKPSVKEIKVINDGPIPAAIEVTLIKTKSPWSISPTCFMINPDETKLIEVVIYLTDTGNYSDTMEIKVTNSRTITVNLTAIGIGTSITVEPPISTVDLGLLYISQKIVKEFVLENRGTRHHQLVWSPVADMKDNAKSAVEFPKHSVFCIEPCKFDLAAKEQEILLLKVECSEICRKTEKIYCHAVINYKEKKQSLLVCEITASFIEPVLKFSKENVAFRVDMGPDDTLDILRGNTVLLLYCLPWKILHILFGVVPV